MTSSVAASTARAYFTIQGIAGAVWWGLLFLQPGALAYFARPEDELLRLAVPDLLLFSVGSLAIAAAASRRSKLTRFLLRVVTIWIALTLVWSGAVAMAGGPLLSFVCMALSLVGSLIAGRCLMVAPAKENAAALRFTPMRDATATRAVVWTLVQVVCVWSVFLGVGPFILIDCERILGVEAFSFRFQKTSAVVLFVLASVFNLATGVTMACVGRGTPLPLACAPRLVVGGAYRYVRNPMAVFGLTQGAAVGVWLGSTATLVYVVAGGLFWELVVRPVEEADLRARFGASYEAYRDAVACWWPRFTPYHGGAAR